ncbi:histidine phosphotransferase family protein [Rhodalgimonas zhirmunskyi]|uniref:Histidine phosphotransferase family protein n=1 Tax=Rhodalgimonas zhirmunskyi TaxID=2964767 RepID=A0AAJ1UAK6_9RHOB|nr:histidine phosphotransferase family protein [Rhodoalgimonas zhirmunskyi]MDQ2093041.1 histidine phosphotransferase family protein [Rhodoalgimonas zhirmunskyi]
MNSTLSIASLVGSRICHDLISPVGAINNGIELLSMGGPLDSPEMALINDSVANASARIKFFRVAFGVASPEQVLGAPEVRGVAEGQYGEGRLSARWLAEGDVARAHVQAAFLSMLCVEAALPLGGEITVERQNSRWTISGTGRRISCDPALWEPLSDGRAPRDLTPAQVQFGLLPMALAEIPPSSRGQIAVSHSDAQVSISY